MADATRWKQDQARTYAQLLYEFRELERENERLRDAIRQHRDSINRGLWPPDRADTDLWKLLDRPLAASKQEGPDDA